MSNIVKSEYERLKNVLLSDKNLNPERLTNVLKSEITQLLSNYMNIEKINFKVVQNEQGKSLIIIQAVTNKFYSFITNL